MTSTPIRRPGLLLLSLWLPFSSVRAEEPALRELLRDALYTEEVTRDPEKAAKQYEELLARHDAQKTFAAAALFRLAEVRRKQDRKDDAIQLYQRLIAEFPRAETEIKLAKENLAALGGKLPEAGAAPVPGNPEDQELARLEAMAVSSPDVLLDSATTLSQAANQGHAKIVKRMLDAGCKPYQGNALENAAYIGNLEIVKLLTNHPDPVPAKTATQALYDRDSKRPSHGARLPARKGPQTGNRDARKRRSDHAHLCPHGGKVPLRGDPDETWRGSRRNGGHRPRPRV